MQVLTNSYPHNAPLCWLFSGLVKLFPIRFKSYSHNNCFRKHFAQTSKAYETIVLWRDSEKLIVFILTKSAAPFAAPRPQRELHGRLPSSPPAAVRIRLVGRSHRDASRTSSTPIRVFLWRCQRGPKQWFPQALQRADQREGRPCVRRFFASVVPSLSEMLILAVETPHSLGREAH